MYGIRMKSETGEKRWFESLGEYMAFGNKRIMQFSSPEEAEEYAQSLELHNYTIEKVGMS